MMLSVPKKRMEELMSGVYHYDKMGMGYRSFGRAIKGDFKQPPFYKSILKSGVWIQRGRQQANISLTITGGDHGT